MSETTLGSIDQRSLTIGEILKSVSLKQRFERIADRSEKVRKPTESEQLLHPPLTTVSLSSEPRWLNDIVDTFFTEHGGTPASPDTIKQFGIMAMHERRLVTEHRNSWETELRFTRAFSELLEIAIFCAQDALSHKGDYSLISIVQEDGTWAKPDLACYTVSRIDPAFRLYHLLVEMKTVNVLNNEVIETILESAAAGGTWRSGNFIPPSTAGKAAERIAEVATSVMHQPYFQLITRTASLAAPVGPSSSNTRTVVASPLYACLSNYNETFVLKRSPISDVGSIELAGPYNPTEIMSIMAALIYEQAVANDNPELRPEEIQYRSSAGIATLTENQSAISMDEVGNVSDTGLDDAGEDDSDFVPSGDRPKQGARKRKRKTSKSQPSGEVNRRGRGGRGGGAGGTSGGAGSSRGSGGAQGTANKKIGKGSGKGTKTQRTSSRVTKRNDIWGGGIRLSAITYDYDIRTRHGTKLFFSDQRKVLMTWDPHHPRAGNASSTPVTPFPQPIPHVTIISRFKTGCAGETLIATSKGAPSLVWKEIPLDDDHAHYAETEVSMYNGPLCSLQGTVVPILYGAFYNAMDDSVVLLMEYVGEALGNDWENVSSEHREQAQALYDRLRAVGVEHNDWEPRNICIDKDDKMRVIDFSHAYEISASPYGKIRTTVFY